jgi:hypothetical protein
MPAAPPWVRSLALADGRQAGPSQTGQYCRRRLVSWPGCDNTAVCGGRQLLLSRKYRDRQSPKEAG